MSSSIEAEHDQTITEESEFVESTNKFAKRFNKFRKLALVEPIFLLLAASSNIFSAGSTNFPLEKVRLRIENYQSLFTCSPIAGLPSEFRLQQ